MVVELTFGGNTVLWSYFLCRLKEYWVFAYKLAWELGPRCFSDKLKIKQKLTWIQTHLKSVTSLVESQRLKWVFPVASSLLVNQAKDSPLKKYQGESPLTVKKPDRQHLTGWPQSASPVLLVHIVLLWHCVWCDRAAPPQSLSPYIPDSFQSWEKIRYPYRTASG